MSSIPFIHKCTRSSGINIVDRFGGARGLMAIIIENGHGNTSQNPEPG